MRRVLPGRFNRAMIVTSAGELELRLSDAGSWQIEARANGETDWRLLCTGNLDGGVFVPPPEDEESAIRVGPLRIDLAGCSVNVRGEPVILSMLEFDLLATLASDPGRVFTRAELMSEVWGSDHPSLQRTLETHASRVRCKLRRAGAPGYVVCYRERGYKLTEASGKPPGPKRG